MSCRSYCDIEGCRRDEDDGEVYSLDFETSEFLKTHLSRWFDTYDDICQECTIVINSDYPDFFLVHGASNLSVNMKYVNNPELLKDRR
jgi:hypothetical protein